MPRRPKRALGGWLTSRGAWLYPVSYLLRDIRVPGAAPGLPAEPGPAVAPENVVPLDLIEWDHLATQGRDHYVKIVYEGYLYPFGHRATLVKVTIGLRPDADREEEGLDQVDHGEAGYHMEQTGG